MNENVWTTLALLLGGVLAFTLGGLLVGWIIGLLAAGLATAICDISFGMGNIALTLAPPFTIAGIVVGATSGWLAFRAWVRR